MTFGLSSFIVIYFVLIRFIKTDQLRELSMKTYKLSLVSKRIFINLEIHLLYLNDESPMRFVIKDKLKKKLSKTKYNSNSQVV